VLPHVVAEFKRAYPKVFLLLDQGGEADAVGCCLPSPIAIFACRAKCEGGQALIG
jgi:hypothetical protein